MCGDIVNENIPLAICTDEKHNSERRQRNVFCVICGEKLVDL
jgi:hypothetical protein